MRKIDTILLSSIYTPIFPIILFLAGWWISLPFLKDNRVAIFAFSGLTAGVIIDVLFLKKWLSAGYNVKSGIMIIIYLFYSLCTFDFFMGVPVFNSLWGIFAGVYLTRKSMLKNSSTSYTLKSLKNVAIFCVAVLFVVCTASACIALSDPYTSGNLQGMFRLNFEITRPILYGIIVIGGSLLLVFQYFLVIFSGKISLRYLMSNNNARLNK